MAEQIIVDTIKLKIDVAVIKLAYLKSEIDNPKLISNGASLKHDIVSTNLDDIIDLICLINARKDPYIAT